MKNRVEVILPPRAETSLELSLVELSKALREKFDFEDSYGLGGQDGYGQNYENDVFMMHRFCWCDEDGCLWCDGDAPNFIFKPTQTSCHWYKWIGRGMSWCGVEKLPNDWLKTCIKSLKGSKDDKPTT